MKRYRLTRHPRKYVSVFFESNRSQVQVAVDPPDGGLLLSLMIKNVRICFSLVGGAQHPLLKLGVQQNLLNQRNNLDMPL